MLGITNKKINTAFSRLRERRSAVGISPVATETPEQEAERIQNEILLAQATGDISSLIRIIANTSGITVEDFIQKTCGSLLFIYYTYLDTLHCVPKDINDLIDGILYLDVKSFIHKKNIDEIKANQKGGPFKR